MLSKEELERYNRHLIMPEIGLKGQEKLKQARVLVVGAGGLGCPVLQYLTAAGVGQIGICDFDYVEVSNLQRQILYSESDIGKYKAEIAANRLEKINPHIRFTIHKQVLDKTNVLQIFSSYDVVVDCTDNFPTRFLVNDACVILNKPFVFGAIYKFEGQVSVFNYKGGPTYRCLIPEEPTQGVTCAEIGVFGVIPGLIGCYQAIEVIKTICEAGSVLSGKMLIIDTLSMFHSLIEIKRNDIHATIKKLGDYGSICSDVSGDINQIKPEELYDLLQKEQVKIIDIRDKEKFGQYHIESENIPISIIFDNLDILPKNQKLVFLCEIGQNSQSLIDWLNQTEEFKDLYNLSGGIQAWIKQGLPIISNK